MRLFLDTHTFLWFINDNPKLSDHFKDLIEDEAHVSYLTDLTHSLIFKDWEKVKGQREKGLFFGFCSLLELLIFRYTA
jgi:hypothetical protein